MSQKSSQGFHSLMRKGLCRILAFCWLTGLFCGMAVYCSAAEMFSTLMRSCIGKAVSIVGLLYVNVLPFLLSVFAVILAAPVMLFPVCFGKAFLTGLIALGVTDLCGCAGWLCRGVFLFSSCAVVPVLYLYWIRSLYDRTGLSTAVLRTFLAAAAILGISVLDFCIISPYWASLIDL